MEATNKNEKIARRIINLLAEEKISLAEANQILNYVKNTIVDKACIQPVNEKLFNCKE